MTPCSYYSPSTFGLFTQIAVVYSIIAQYVQWILGNTPQIQQVRMPTIYDEQKTVVITGSNTGIGYETAHMLALYANYRVIMACRSREKAEMAIAYLNVAFNAVDFIQPLDLTDETSIRDFCAALVKKYDKIDILINNAGRNTSFNSNGRDCCFQTNFTGHYLLTSLLLPHMNKNGRIVNLASVMHHYCKEDNTTNNNNERLPMETVQYWQDVIDYDKHPTDTYSLSKLAAILFTIQLNKRYGDKITAVAVNPGGVNSDIWRDFPRIVVWLMSFLLLDSKKGSSCSVAAALGDWSEYTANNNNVPVYLQPYWLPYDYKDEPPLPIFETMGPYVGYRVTRPRLPSDNGLAASEALWEVCEKVTGAKWQAIK